MVVGWICVLCLLVIMVQNELIQELKLQEFQDSLKKVEKVSFINLIFELKVLMDELCQVVELMKCFYVVNDFEKVSDEVYIIYNLVVKDNEVVYEGVMFVVV